MRRYTGFILIATPFMFGVIRFATTSGLDGRYLLIALAALIGAASAFPRGDAHAPVGLGRLAAGTATGALAAAIASVILGGRSAVSVSIVAVCFGACVASGFWLVWRGVGPQTVGATSGTV